MSGAPGPGIKRKRGGEGKERTGKISLKEAWLDEVDANGDW